MHLICIALNSVSVTTTSVNILFKYLLLTFFPSHFNSTAAKILFSHAHELFYVEINLCLLSLSESYVHRTTFSSPWFLSQRFSHLLSLSVGQLFVSVKTICDYFVIFECVSKFALCTVNEPEQDSTPVFNYACLYRRWDAS